MTVIVGCVGAAGSWRDKACEQMLQGQAAFASSHSTISTSDDASFGAAADRNPEEDRRDQQPLDVDRFMLVADVRLSNRPDLLRELRQSDAKLSDSAIVLKAWLNWQERCFDRFAGEFAIAVWDKAEQRLTLARDPTGQRPLFYAVQGDFAAFSTMASGLLAIPAFRNGFNRRRLSSMLTGLEGNGDETYFANIQKVRPGCVVSIAAGSVKAWRHWWPPQEELRLSDQEFAEAYHENLRAAVSAALPSSNRLGVHLSSGLDSSAVAATAATLWAGDQPLAFTSAPRLHFDGPVPRNRVADESRLASLTAAKHGLSHVIVRDDSRILDRAREQCRYYEEPRCDVANMAWVRAVAAAAEARGVATLLTAEMGNLSLHAGGLPALAELVRERRWRSWWSQARAAARSRNANWKGILYNSFGHELSSGADKALARLFLKMPSQAEQSFARDEHGAAPRTPSILNSYNGRYSPRFELISRYDIGTFRKGALAEFGIRERDPTADRRLLDFSFRLPPSQMLDGGIWRPLARRALGDILPPEVLNSPVRGYQGADWYERLTQADARALFEEICSSTEATELLDTDKVRSAIDAWPSRGWADARIISLYRVRLPIALLTGVFIQEFEDSTR